MEEKKRDKIFVTMGASNHSSEEREKDDFYATDPIAINLLLDVEEFEGVIWEPAAGQFHMVNRLRELGKEVVATDLVDRGFDVGGVDFLKEENSRGQHIITNPPNKLGLEFIKKGCELLKNDGDKLALFLPVRYLSGQKRGKLYETYQPSRVWICRKRVVCAKNAEFAKIKSTAIDYMWIVWEKGYQGKCQVGWIN